MTPKPPQPLAPSPAERPTAPGTTAGDGPLDADQIAGVAGGNRFADFIISSVVQRPTDRPAGER